MNIQEFHKKWLAENPNWNIAEKMAYLIKSTRIEAGLTQHELAKKMKTKQESIARAEKGTPNNTASLEYLDRVAKACGKTLILPEIK